MQTIQKIDPLVMTSVKGFVLVQLRHFFSLKISQFTKFQSLLDEFRNYFWTKSTPLIL